MHDHDTKPDRPNTEPGRRARARRWLGAAFAAALGSVLTLGALGGIASSHGWRGHAGVGHHDRQAVMEHLDYLLTRVEASPAQRAALEAITEAAWNDLQGAHEEHRANRDAMVEALTAASVDRQRLQALRDAELQLLDRVSQRMLAAVADAGEVLDADQRRALAERFSRRFH